MKVTVRADLAHFFAESVLDAELPTRDALICKSEAIPASASWNPAGNRVSRDEPASLR